VRLVSRLLLSSSLVAASACYYEGEFGYLEFELDPIVDPLTEFESGDQVLGGSVICPKIVTAQGEWVDPRERMRACFAESLTGPYNRLDDDGCLHLDGPGEADGKVIWELTPRSCGDRVDRLRFAIVPGDPQLELDFDEWRLRAILLTQDPRLGLETVGLAPGRDLEALLDPPGAARHVIADQIDVPLMRLRNAKGVVYWTAPEVELEVIGEGVEVVAPITAHDEHIDPGELAVRLEPGASGHVRATLPNGEVLVSPPLVAVANSDAASLDLLRIDGHLVADVRDTEGRQLHAAPVEWSVVEGALGIVPGDLSNHLRTREFATIEPRCQPPPEDGPELRHAIVRARVGDVEDTVMVEWTASPRSDPTGEWAPADSCMFGATPDPPVEQGCSCNSAPVHPMNPISPAAPGLASLAVLALIRRRRS
jgi:MYXO-CTERM domain-containing protein